MTRDGDADAHARPLPRDVTFALAACGLVILAGQIALGTDKALHFPPDQLLRGLLAIVGLDAPLPHQALLQIRVCSALTSAGVGACLAVAGALLQGLLRNPLADPSLLGVTSGASLGATAALLALGGIAPLVVREGLGELGPWLVSGAALVGALLVTGIVVILGQRLTGRGGIAMLVLLGVALNSCMAGAIAAVQDGLFAAQRLDLLGALQAWSMGALHERQPYHVLMVACGVFAAVLVIPRVARELDLLAGGDDDARSLGVDVTRVRVLVVVTAAFATACAVAAAGPIGFVGLVVPQVVRLAVGASHRRVLWLTLLGGAVFVPGLDLLQLVVLGERTSRPNVQMTLLGGTFFLALLFARSRSRLAW